MARFNPFSFSPRNANRRGSAIIELSLTLGVLLSLTFGMVEFGYFMFLKNTVQGAAREGARAAIPAGAANGDVTAAVNAALSAAGLATGNYTIKIRNVGDTADMDISTSTAGTAVLVKVYGTWSTVGAGYRPLGVIGSSKQLTGTAVMRKEG